jgi:hypothetical protein
MAIKAKEFDNLPVDALVDKEVRNLSVDIYSQDRWSGAHLIRNPDVQLPLYY